MKKIILYLLTAILISSCDDGNSGGSHKMHDGTQKYRVTKANMETKDFTLTNQDGEKITLSNLKGSVVVLAFVYTSCEKACPVFEKRFLRLQKRYFNRFGTDLNLLFVTVDPVRDTVEKFKKRSLAIGANTKGWHFLTGSKEEVQKVLDDYLVHVELIEGTTDFIHPQRVYLINKEGNIEYRIAGLEYPDDVIKDKLNELL